MVSNSLKIIACAVERFGTQTFLFASAAESVFNSWTTGHWARVTGPSLHFGENRKRNRIHVVLQNMHILLLFGLILRF